MATRFSITPRFPATSPLRRPFEVEITIVHPESEGQPHILFTGEGVHVKVTSRVPTSLPAGAGKVQHEERITMILFDEPARPFPVGEIAWITYRVFFKTAQDRGIDGIQIV